MEMNVVSAIASNLMGEKAGKVFNWIQKEMGGETPKTSGEGSFLSILNQLDSDGDGSIQQTEYKSGLEQFIDLFIQGRDTDGDQALNVDEAGIAPGAFSRLDTDADALLEKEEIGSEAGRILEGVVSLLDIDGDKELSREELAIFELLLGGLPSLDSNTGSDVDTVFTRNGSGANEKLELNLDTLPDQMRKAGFQGSDNALYYALAHVYHYGPEAEMPDDGAGSLSVLNTQREAIYKWFDGELSKAAEILKKNPQTTLTAITNDGRDRCGFRLGPAIMEKLKEFGGRVQLGTVVPESDY
ncbi:MAG: hypothetical protein AB1585_18025 [Thermodesulfobacteriota bacterium]